MACCELGPGEELPTVRHLIHDLSSYWIDQSKPVFVGLYDAAGEYREFVVTGVTNGRGGNSLDLRPVER